MCTTEDFISIPSIDLKILKFSADVDALKHEHPRVYKNLEPILQSALAVFKQVRIELTAKGN